MKDLKVVSAKSVEHLVEDLRQDVNNGWEVAAYFQEFGVTKILLQKETK